MNERIKELLEESYSHFGHGKYRTPELVAEKFAELIVGECAELCSTNEMTIEPFGKKSYRTGRHFSALLKGHFGVE